jgi:hypothetical protein
VEVPPVDERHFDGSSSQFQDGLESAEAAADDDHSVWVAAALARARTSRNSVQSLRESILSRRRSTEVVRRAPRRPARSYLTTIFGE